MNKYIMLMLLTMGNFAFSQVGIGTTAPHASSEVDLAAVNKALYLNRVANTSAVNDPQPGMMVYDQSGECVRVYEGDPAAWSACLGGQTVHLTCDSASFSGPVFQNNAYSGTLTIPYTGGKGTAYPAQSFTENGLTFTLPAGNFSNGAGDIVYTVSGTAPSSGNFPITIAIGGQSCSVTLSVIATVSNPPGTVASLTCASAAFDPASATQGTAYTGTLTMPYTGGNGGAYPAQSFTANGLTFTLLAGNFAAGSGSVQFSITGTPTAATAISGDITVGGQTCSLTLPVNSQAPTNPVGTGSLSGRICFDVVEQFVSNDCGTIASRTPQKANFALVATNTQTYKFTPTGTVSNVRFVYANTNGQVIQSITGGNAGNNISTAVNATVVYYNNLNAAATGLSRSQALLADIYVIYNDGATNNGTDRQLKLTARVQDCACCGAMVSATVWKEFMCHNLGADTSLDPFTPVVGLQGAYIQWGKRGPNTTGDSSVDWRTAASSPTTGFAAAPTSANAGSNNWAGQWSTTNAATNAWNSGTEAAPIKTANDPCPTGYRVPTRNEWVAVNTYNTASRTGTTWTDSSTNYGTALNYGPNASSKLLTLPTAGERLAPNYGLLGQRGAGGYYWSSTAAPNNIEGNLSAYAITFNQSTINAQYYYYIGRLYGSSVRCIAQ